MTHRARILASLALAAAALTGCSDEPAVLVGRVSPSAAALLAPKAPDGGKTTVLGPRDADRLRIRINDQPRDVRLGSDLSFSVQELPTGDVTITIEAEGISGSITIKDVGGRELIEVVLEAGDGRLSIRVVRRHRGHDDHRRVPPPGPVVISGHHQEVYLEPGRYDSITISGHHIRVVGAARSCDPADRSIVEDVTISGHHVQLLDVDVAGQYRVSGHHVRAYATCGHGGHDTGDNDDDDDQGDGRSDR